MAGLRRGLADDAATAEPRLERILSETRAKAKQAAVKRG
jgi:hypothetical protein